MEELDLKKYLNVLINKWVWIVSVVLITLIIGLIIKIGFTKPPEPEYYTSVNIDLGQVVFSDKTLPDITFIQKELDNFSLSASKAINIENDNFSITYSNPSTTSIKIDIKTKKGAYLEKYSSKLQNIIYNEIIKRNKKNLDETYNKLNKYYKSKVSDTNGLNNELIRLISTDESKQNEIKPLELRSGEKVLSDMIKRLDDIKKLISNANEERANINATIKTVINNKETTEKNIYEYDIFLKSLKNNNKEALNDEFIQKQIIFFEGNLELFKQYKIYYDNLDKKEKENLHQNQILLDKLLVQQEFQNNEIIGYKSKFDERLVLHNSQLEIIKNLNNIYNDNSILNSKITISPIIINQLKFIDTRIRKVVVSVWLSFILVCGIVLFTEYFRRKNQNFS